MCGAVFFDRDGVLIENCPNYVRNWEDVHFFPFAFEAIRLVKSAGMKSFVVTNQAIVGKEILSLEHIDNLNKLIIDHFNANNAPIAGAYLCPHIDDDNCECRKPKPGMLLRAAREFDIDLSRSVMIGDAISDLMAGISAGTNAILVRTGRGSDQERQMSDDLRTKVPVCDDVLIAVQQFLAVEVRR